MAEHETLKASRKVAMPSDRSFGLVFAALFLIIGFWPAIRHAEAIRWWPVAIGLLFGLSAFFNARILAPLNRLWFQLGMAMHSVMSPIIMGVLFFGVVVPFALVLKAFGKDLLRLRASTDDTYWISRDPPGPRKGSMTQQF